MLRTLIAILLLLAGVVGIAGGVWGFSLAADSEVDPALADAAKTILDYAGEAATAADTWITDVTGGLVNITNAANEAVGDAVDLQSESSLTAFAALHALEILLCGVIGIESGLLLFKYR